MLEALICPQTHATLRYDAAAQELISQQAGLAFPIRGGIISQGGMGLRANQRL
ncbi:MAG: Trm112 family protein [Pseudomonadota bacterium]